ncbi:helix-turn-helix domain-containing protein [Actinocatenispora sera]|uniref:AraC family transcriptional regulator n=1 Tax=Actinocatenispora sera TaxID=390989 RepID=A0A810KY55_9ACTN|nr:helix-turn-helix domain-containing protein [Actinocatenispora sera]BCJ27362.1 AraC family transcriptional regulator [Actinocatenispora sera]
MRAGGRGRDVTAGWDVVSPGRPGRLPGVIMAGFDVLDLAAPVRLVPHPAVTVVVEFGAGQPIVADAAGRERRGSLVAGPGFGLGGALARGADVTCVQVRLSPVLARSILGVAAGDLSGIGVPLDDLWGADAARLRERLAAAASWPDRFALVEEALARRRRPGSYPDPEVAWAWRRLVAGRGLVRIDPLAAEVGWSRKRLWSRFAAQLGLPPKRAATLIRFDHAAYHLATGRDPARVAADAGYADQSHLHREVVSCTGVTPATLAEEPFLAVDDVAWPTLQRRRRGPGFPARQAI